MFREVVLENQGNWFHSNNDMAQNIYEKFEGQAEIRSFIWSGKNSIKSRSNAAIKLSEMIQEDQKQKKADQIFLVAHSHGGTVVAECLAKYWNKLSALPLGGIICLATPFIYHDERINAERKNKILLMSALFFLLFSLQLFIDSEMFLQSNLISYFTFFGLLLMSGSLAVLVLNVLSKNKSSAQFTICGKIKYFPPFHLIRTARDEASGLIGFASFLSWLLIKSYSLIEPRTEIFRIDDGKRSGFIGMKLKFTQIIFFAGILFISYFSSKQFGLSIEGSFPILLFALSGMISTMGIISYIVYMLICGEYSPRNWVNFNVEMEQTIPSIESKLELVKHDDVPGTMRHGLHSLPIVQSRVAEILFDWAKSVTIVIPPNKANPRAQ